MLLYICVLDLCALQVRSLKLVRALKLVMVAGLFSNRLNLQQDSRLLSLIMYKG